MTGRYIISRNGVSDQSLSMIILKLGIVLGVILVKLRDNVDKIVIFIFYTVFIPFLIYQFIVIINSGNEGYSRSLVGLTLLL